MFGVLALGAASGNRVAHLAETSTPDGSRRLVRIGAGGQWERWDGFAWAVVPTSGIFSGLEPIWSAVIQGYLIAASYAAPTLRLQKWTGNDADVVTDLSGDAPKALLFATIDQRGFAAYIDRGSGYDPDAIAFSADGDVTDWTTDSKGAGSAILQAEGGLQGRDEMRGLVTVPNGIMILREKSIVLGTRTGIGSQPFRYITVVNNIGVRYGKTATSIGNIGAMFLGSDEMVYITDGSPGSLRPVGTAIWPLLHDDLKTLGIQRKDVDATYDRNTNLAMLRVFDKLYILDVSTVNDPIPAWAVITSPFTLRCCGFGWTGTGTEDQNLLLGGDTANKTVYSLSTDNFDSGIANLGGIELQTRVYGSKHRKDLVDAILIEASASADQALLVDYSEDNGKTWTNAGTITVLGASGIDASMPYGLSVQRILRNWQFRLRAASGAGLSTIVGSPRIRKVSVRYVPNRERVAIV